MSQAVIVYVTYATDVLLICWCGTQLTQRVRQNELFCCWHNLKMCFKISTRFYSFKILHLLLKWLIKHFLFKGVEKFWAKSTKFCLCNFVIFHS